MLGEAVFPRSSGTRRIRHTSKTLSPRRGCLTLFSQLTKARSIDIDARFPEVRLASCRSPPNRRFTIRLWNPAISARKTLFLPAPILRRSFRSGKNKCSKFSMLREKRAKDSIVGSPSFLGLGIWIPSTDSRVATENTKKAFSPIAGW